MQDHVLSVLEQPDGEPRTQDPNVLDAFAQALPNTLDPPASAAMCTGSIGHAVVILPLADNNGVPISLHQLAEAATALLRESQGATLSLVLGVYWSAGRRFIDRGLRIEMSGVSSTTLAATCAVIAEIAKQEAIFFSFDTQLCVALAAPSGTVSTILGLMYKQTAPAPSSVEQER